MNHGHVAYEAYRTDAGGKSLVSGHPIPAWAELAERIRSSWNVAAAAVEARVGDGPLFADVRRLERGLIAIRDSPLSGADFTDWIQCVVEDLLDGGEAECPECGTCVHEGPCVSGDSL